METMVLYHGSDIVVRNPDIRAGKPNNDYGRGFYCTEDIELGREWSCSRGKGTGILNVYKLHSESLNIIDLSTNTNALQWITLLLKHRKFDITGSVARSAYSWLIKHCSIDIGYADVIVGYRADDSYFSYAKDFINNALSLEELDKALRLGNLGKQVVLKSDKAYKAIEFIRHEVVEYARYGMKYRERDIEARNEYFNRDKQPVTNGIYIMDLMRGRI